MAKKHKPRSGSLAFYPRKRAKQVRPRMTTVNFATDKCKALNFLGYKAGMTHIIGKDEHKAAPTFSHEISVPVSIIEVPPMKVFGFRCYEKTPYGLNVVYEEHSKEFDKNLPRKIISLKHGKGKDKRKEEKEKTKEKKTKSIDEIKSKIYQVRLLCHTQPYLTGIGKKKPEITEVYLSGKIEEQLNFAREKLGKDIKISEVFAEKEFVDVKAVTKGKGFSGVIKRFGVKQHRPKAKKRRVVGSLGAITPGMVMWTVARPGQLGFQTRTEYNKKIVMISDKPEKINHVSGFNGYGLIKNDFIVLEGSVIGPRKRVVALRKAIRIPHEKKLVNEVKLIGTKA